jgi:flagellin
MANVDVTRIAGNIGALNALNSLQNINKQLATHQARLQTGKAINSAADDPAGLTIATKMLARSEGMKVALNNIGDASNMLSVAEGGMSKMNDILVQMRNKAEQAASDTLGSTERSAIQTQLSAYATQIQDLVDNTKWNGVKLLDQSTGTKTFQTGADEGDKMQWSMADKLDPTTMNVSQNITLATAATVTAGSGSFAGQASTTAMATLSKLDTGRYSVEVLDKALATNQGKINPAGTYMSGVGGMGGNAAALGGGVTEIVSGNYTFKITGGTGLTDGSNVDYQVLKDDSTVAFSGTGVDLSGGTAKNLLIGAAGATGNSGLTVTVSGGMTSGTTVGFEYIARGDVKYELNDAQGVAQSISKNGTTAATASYGYYNLTAGAKTGVNTGRGFTFDTGTFGATTATDSRSFDYLATGTNVVDVSSATKAAAYMTTVNTALDTVTKGLSNLGSLMSRLNFKEEAVTTAQANVEASYNRIMNANMADEQVQSSKFSILQQTATAMLAQANQAPQNLLSLFR